MSAVENAVVGTITWTLFNTVMRWPWGARWRRGAVEDIARKPERDSWGEGPLRSHLVVGSIFGFDGACGQNITSFPADRDQKRCRVCLRLQRRGRARAT